MSTATDINIEEALKIIDDGLGRTMSRELMSTVEVTDLLLDVRTALANAGAAADSAGTVEPVPAPIG